MDRKRGKEVQKCSVKIKKAEEEAGFQMFNCIGLGIQLNRKF